MATTLRSVSRSVRTGARASRVVCCLASALLPSSFFASYWVVTGLLRTQYCSTGASSLRHKLLNLREALSDLWTIPVEQ